MVPSLGGTNWERSEALEGVLCVGFFLAAAANEIIYVSCRAFYVLLNWRERFVCFGSRELREERKWRLTTIGK